MFVLCCHGSSSPSLGIFFFSSRRRHTRWYEVTGVQTCALPISSLAGLVCCGGYFFGEPLDRNWTVTLSQIGNCCVVSFKSITASRMSRSLLSDGSPVEMLFLPIIAEILATDPLSLFPSRASAWITTLCPTETLSTSRSSISALMWREEVSARLNNGRGVTVLKD